MSQLMLRIMLPSQQLASSVGRLGPVVQTRQTEIFSLIRVEVSGVGMVDFIRADCPLPGGAPPQCRVTIDQDSITITLALMVLRGPGRTLVVTAFDQAGMVIRRGSTTLDIGDTTHVVNVTITDVSVTFAPLTGSTGG